MLNGDPEKKRQKQIAKETKSFFEDVKRKGVENIVDNAKQSAG